MPFAGTTAPQGCLFCDGSAVSRTTYAALFEVIGTTYGEGDGSTTFNIPDLSGRVVIGVSNTHALGTTGGSETVTLTADQMPAHTHVVPQHGHENNIAVQTPVLRHEITAQPAYNYNSPNRARYVAAGTATMCRGTSNATATRSIDVSIAEHLETACTTGGSITAKEAFNSGLYGGGASHNNMQPYTAVNYLICVGE